MSLLEIWGGESYMVGEEGVPLAGCVGVGGAKKSSVAETRNLLLASLSVGSDSFSNDTAGVRMERFLPSDVLDSSEPPEISLKM